MIPFINGVLGMIIKGLERGLEELKIGGRAETIQSTAMQRSARIQRKSLGDLRRLAVTLTSKKNNQVVRISDPI